MSEMLKRPQDESLDGKGWTYRNCEHGGDEPDTMPQAIEATDPSGVTAIYAYYKPPSGGQEGATPTAHDHGNCELCDQIERELSALRAQYLELIMQVGNKHPNETRHQTALRYLRQAEQSSDTPAQANAAPRSGGSE